MSLCLMLTAGVTAASAQYATGIVLYGSPSYNNGYNYNTGYTSYDPYNYNYNQNYNYNNGYNYSPVSVTSNYTSPYYNYDYTNYNNGYNYNYNYGYNYNQPSITTNAATNIGTTYATVNGYITTNQSNYTTGTGWFEYGTSSGNLTSRSNSTNIYSSTSLSSNLSNLTCGTTYYFRPVFSGSYGLQYGNQMSFTTTSCQYNYNYNYNNGYNYNQNYYPSNTYGPHCGNRTWNGQVYYQ